MRGDVAQSCRDPFDIRPRSFIRTTARWLGAPRGAVDHRMWPPREWPDTSHPPRLPQLAPRVSGPHPSLLRPESCASADARPARCSFLGNSRKDSAECRRHFDASSTKLKTRVSPWKAGDNPGTESPRGTTPPRNPRPQRLPKPPKSPPETWAGDFSHRGRATRVRPTLPSPRRRSGGFSGRTGNRAASPP